MRKQTIQYTSPLDALVAVTKRLSLYENQQKNERQVKNAIALRIAIAPNKN